MASIHNDPEYIEYTDLPRFFTKGDLAVVDPTELIKALDDHPNPENPENWAVLWEITRSEDTTTYRFDSWVRKPAIPATTTSDKDNHITFGVTSHYNQYKGFEVIDVCEQLRAPDGGGQFNRGNAFKYLARAGWKNPDKHIEDLQKAKQYLEREIARVTLAQSENSKDPS